MIQKYSVMWWVLRVQPEPIASHAGNRGTWKSGVRVAFEIGLRSFGPLTLSPHRPPRLGTARVFHGRTSKVIDYSLVDEDILCSYEVGAKSVSSLVDFV